VNLAGAIYGTVIATALVAGLSEDKDLAPGEIAISVSATMLAFWIAHAYANLLAGDTSGGRLPSWREARRAMAHEWTLVEAAAPAIVFLMLGEFGVLSVTTAKDLAVWIGLVTLAGYGWGLARKGGMGLGRRVAVSLASAALGAIVIAVKLAVE
jgi:hypothetical protein